MNLKKVLFSALAGVLVACTIFVSTMVPWVLKTSTSPSQWSHLPLLPLPPITTTLDISNFSEPQGPFSEANLTVTITSETNLFNVVISVSISKADALWSSKGIAFDIFGEGAFWVVNLTAGLPITFNVKVKTVEIGCGKIEATARWNGWENYQPSRDLLGIVVLEDEIQVWEDFHGALPIPLPPDFQLPHWENWTTPIPLPPIPYP
jgi:hypothetical protein